MRCKGEDHLCSCRVAYKMEIGGMHAGCDEVLDCDQRLLKLSWECGGWIERYKTRRGYELYESVKRFLSDRIDEL